MQCHPPSGLLMLLRAGCKELDNHEPSVVSVLLLSDKPWPPPAEEELLLLGPWKAVMTESMSVGRPALCLGAKAAG